MTREPKPGWFRRKNKLISFPLHWFPHGIQNKSACGVVFRVFTKWEPWDPDEEHPNYCLRCRANLQ